MPFCKSSRAALLAAVLATPAVAQEYRAGTLVISQPWARATPGGAKVGGGYFKVTNAGTALERLVGGSAEVAERLELHQSTLTDGVASMRSLASGIEIKPGETIELKPGAIHVMLVNLKRPLKAGERIAATLAFEKAGPVAVEFSVALARAATDPPSTVCTAFLGRSRDDLSTRRPDHAMVGCAPRGWTLQYGNSLAG